MPLTKFITLMLCATTLVSTTGCGTIMNLSTNKKIYGGIQNDLGIAAQCTVKQVIEPENFLDDGLRPTLMSLIDLPLSAVADTATLPVTVPVALGLKSEPETRKKKVNKEDQDEKSDEDEADEDEDL